MSTAVKVMSPESELLAETQAPEVAACQHHWVIDRPRGPVSKGICRHCSEVREFLNYVEGSRWGYDISLEQLAGGSRYPAGVALSGTQDRSELEEDA